MSASSCAAEKRRLCFACSGQFRPHPLSPNFALVQLLHSLLVVLGPCSMREKLQHAQSRMPTVTYALRGDACLLSHCLSPGHETRLKLLESNALSLCRRREARLKIRRPLESWSTLHKSARLSPSSLERRGRCRTSSAFWILPSLGYCQASTPVHR